MAAPDASRPTHPDRATTAEDVVERWRGRLLPFMMLMLVLGSVFFGVVSVVQVRELDKQLVEEAKLVAVPPRPEILPATEASYAYDVTVALEQGVIARRYHFALGMIRVRLWTRMLGFSAGMVLAMVGAAFVLGRLQEPASRLSARGGGLALSLTSASPGLLLAVLGTLLMISSIAVSPNVTTSDGAVYVPHVEEVPTESLQPADLPPPRQLPD